MLEIVYALTKGGNALREQQIKEMRRKREPRSREAQFGKNYC
jgi:hypothetical protein